MKKLALLFVVISILLMAACAAPSTPQVIRETVVVEVTTVVETEKIVEQTVVVEKEVQVEVTPTPEPTAAPQMIMGFPAANEQEANTAQAAFDAADKGNPDPAWKGQSFTIGAFSGGQRGAISGPLYFWRQKFEELTGATYDIVEIPYGELREKIYTDFQTGAHKYDVIVNCSNWYGDAIANDWIQPVDKYLDDPRMPKQDLESITPAVANLLQWGGQMYGANNDHDAQILYYRKDILGDPKWQEAYKTETGEDMPVAMDTWEDVIKIAKFFNGKDWNGDGDPDDGIAMHLKVGQQGFFHYLALSAPYVVTAAPGDDPMKVTEFNNVYFFNPETMDPLVCSPGHVKALETLIELSKAGPSAAWAWGLGEAWADFLSGNAVMTFSWGDVGSLVQDPSQSSIQGLLGARGLPGTKSPYNFETEQFMNMDDPNMVGNQVGCSWHPVLSKYAKNPDLAAYFMNWQGTPEINHWNVYMGWTGVDPGTTYDWLEPVGKATVQEYVDGGYNAADAEEFIGAYQDNFYNYPLFVTYLRIPGTPEMAETMDVHLSEAITGQVSPQEALDRTCADWTRIVDDFGREDLKKLYQDSIGYTPAQ